MPVYKYKHLSLFHSVSRDTFKALVHAFITSRVDYFNILLYGLPASHLNTPEYGLSSATLLSHNAVAVRAALATG